MNVWKSVIDELAFGMIGSWLERSWSVGCLDFSDFGAVKAV